MTPFGSASGSASGLVVGSVAGGALLYGGDYNPDQWPEQVWREDVELMRAAGVNVVSLGVFSWASLEPGPGEWDFGWLDRVVDLLHAGGIRVGLATPTASPPPWLGHRWPSTLPVDESGHRLGYGSRNQYCPSSPVYRQRALAVVGALARRYGVHPGLAFWHVGNEFGPVCHCEATAGHFRRWLRARYGSLDALNAAWGTAVWSQRYGAWEQVTTPRRAPYHRNPTQVLDFRRFTSDALLDHFRAERALLRELAPQVPATTNFIAPLPLLDWWRWARHEDVVSLDWYCDPQDQATHLDAAFGYDLTRSVAGPGPWLLLEQAPGAVTWRRRNAPKRPGQLRLWSMQAVARGADGVCFFQWRAARAGAERHHSAMVPHAGADTRIHREVAALGAELGRLRDVVGQPVPASVALVFDWDNWWALADGEGHPTCEFDLLERVRAFHRPLCEAGVTVDAAHPEADLSAYRLAVVPGLHLLTDAAAANLASYVDGGGTLVMGFNSGVVDGNNHVRTGGHPGALREVFGLRVEEVWPLAPGEQVRCVSPSLGRFAGRFWAELLRCEGAEAVATVDGGDLDGTAAVLRHAWGAGTAWYVATEPEPSAMAALLARVRAEAGVRPVLPAVPPGVEAVRRGELLFVLNHSVERVEVAVPGVHTDLLTGHRHAGRVCLDRYGVMVLRPQPAGSP